MTCKCGSVLYVHRLFTGYSQVMIHGRTKMLFGNWFYRAPGAANFVSYGFISFEIGAARYRWIRRQQDCLIRRFRSGLIVRDQFHSGRVRYQATPDVF